MLTFVVPVKSKSVTSNWFKFSQIFERTLKSICNQTDSNFKVLVVCHEIPIVDYTHENLHFVHPDFHPPNKDYISPKEFLIKKRIDKGNKIKLGVEYASKIFNTDYIMLVDSDDFVSNRIASFVNRKGNELPGWYIGKGYLSLNWKSILVVAKKNFNHLCGSSVIVKPNVIKHFFDKGKIDLYFDHRLTTLDSNIELKNIPFPGGIYNMGNGENIHMSYQNVKDFSYHGNWISFHNIRRLYYRFRRYQFRIITPRLRKEFNFYPA
ncbi:glycosyltransferase family A protein [Winogradskyella sp. A2]|uniref:glycosyltransferase family A protein n=1 Tax=Winogradskyella sp. A2 TaxID=3366944 RepID=UPI00398C2C01